MVKVGTSARSGANSDHDRERFPSLVDDIGHDPARWLDWPLVDDAHQRRLTHSVVRGLADVTACNAWVAVERALGRGADDGPREPVLEWIDDRRQELVEMGREDFDDWLDTAPKLDVEPAESSVVLLRKQADGSVEKIDPDDRVGTPAHFTSQFDEVSA